MICINTSEELSLYDLEGKWNDYIAVQKEVISVLKREKFFEIEEIINVETNMRIRINTRGIKETIGNGNRFQHLPKDVKMQKIATLRLLPLMLQDGKLIEDDVKNYHGESGDRFAYFRSKAVLDGCIYDIRIVIRKKVGSNHFYIHHIDTEKVLNYSAHP